MDITFDVVLHSPKRDSTKITNTVLSIEIYENIDKPYLTGILEFFDTGSNFYGNYKFEGSERVEIALRGTANNSSVNERTFYVSKVIRVSRDDQSNSIVLHLVEDIAFISNLQNVNRSYVGTSSQIITKIASNYLNKNVLTTNQDTNTIKTIIPNLDPVEAMEWIRNDATTVDGYPFYLFSTLGGSSDLKFVDLETMLSFDPINADDPYIYDRAALSHPLEQSQKRMILDFDVKDNEDLYSIIQKGFVGSNYEVIDLLTGTYNKIHFDVLKDLFAKLHTKLANNQRDISYSPMNRIDFDSPIPIAEELFSNIDSKTIAQIGTSQVYNNGVEYHPSYGEKKTEFEYKRHIISRSFQMFMRKTSIIFAAEGDNYSINPSFHRTIGNNIRVLFPSTSENDKNLNDQKLSGDYLINAAQHIIRPERYDIKYSGVKIASYDT